MGAINLKVMGDDTVTVSRDAAAAADVGVYYEDIQVGGVKRVTQTTGLDFDDFTDGGSTSGHVDLTTALPAGALVIGWRATVATGFTGDTTAVIGVGVSGDTDRFSQDGTQSVLAAATVGSANPATADGGDGLNAAQTVRITVTGTADFTSIAAGSISLFEVFYI
jgi:hypothetical protein